MIKIIISVNIHNHSFTVCVCVCVCEMRTFKIHSVSRFQIYNRGCLVYKSLMWSPDLNSFCYFCCCSVAKLCATLCYIMDCSRKASLSFTLSQSLPKLMSIESLMPSNHLILCHPFSSCLQSFSASESFPVSQFFTSGGQSIGASASASVLPMNIQG